MRGSTDSTRSTWAQPNQPILSRVFTGRPYPARRTCDITEGMETPDTTQPAEGEEEVAGDEETEDSQESESAEPEATPA